MLIVKREKRTESLNINVLNPLFEVVCVFFFISCLTKLECFLYYFQNICKKECDQLNEGQYRHYLFAVKLVLRRSSSEMLPLKVSGSYAKEEVDYY